ncbi:hypothetical protein RSSE_p0842 (plasmid) [Ralstonia solanacearum]|nr:hypothetical protein RSSE_p0842 [Ralstonia solanacearum]
MQFRSLGKEIPHAPAHARRVARAGSRRPRHHRPGSGLSRLDFREALQRAASPALLAWRVFRGGRAGCGSG